MNDTRNFRVSHNRWHPPPGRGWGSGKFEPHQFPIAWTPFNPKMQKNQFWHKSPTGADVVTYRTTLRDQYSNFRLICGMNEGFPSQGLICFVCDFTIRTHWTHCEFLPVWSTRTFKFQEHKWSLCLVEKRYSLEMIDSWLGLYWLTFDVIFWGKSLNLLSAWNS